MSNNPKTDHNFEALLDFISRSRGFNFTAYKRSTLTRRIRRRMQMVGIDDYQGYVDYLEVNPDEYTDLFNNILINVTDFFRDPEAWVYIAEEILPRVISKKDPDKPLRFWCAGCASGEETYTLALLVAEALGEDEFRQRVKIYATDVDETDLNHARLASYTPKEVQGIPSELLEKYFEKAGDRYAFRRDLRRSIIFGRNNLIQDAPISRIDLLVCRNTLMYFNAEAQEKILGRLHFALNDDGYIFLGKAEMLQTHNNLFSPVNLKWRIFSKVPKYTFRERLSVMSPGGNEEVVNHLMNQVRLREAAYDAGHSPQFVVDLDGKLALANESARAMFGINPNDIDRQFHELQVSYQPVELRSSIKQVMTNYVPIHFKDVIFVSGPGGRRYLEVQVIPLFDNGKIMGVSITFTDLSTHKKLQHQLESTNNDLETALEELQSTNEELETTNEELQSTVEELENTNEEIQSSNEELETMNEELQSTNEELETMNEELNRNTYELNESSALLDSILTSIHAGIIVIDREFSILAWNHTSTEYWGLSSDEVLDQNLLKLDIGLPVDCLKRSVLRCLSGESKYEELILEARNRRGKLFMCKTGVTPLVNSPKEVKGAILLMQEEAGETGES